MSNVRCHHFYPIVSNRLASVFMASLAISAIASVAGEPSAVVVLEVSWANGSGAVRADSHYRVEQVGVELVAVVQEAARPFVGKIGPCVRRHTFKYPDTALQDQSYYFFGDSMIELHQKRDRFGTMYAFDPLRSSATAQFLAQLAPVPPCAK